MNQIMSKNIAIALLLFAGALAAQTHSTTQQQHSPAVARQLKIVAGVVGDSGTVKYLPRVSIRLMPKGYAASENAATSAYTADMERLRSQRDQEIRVLVEGRRNDLDAARRTYNDELASALQSVSLTAIAATPRCVSLNAILHKIESCDLSYTSGKKTMLSDSVRRLLADHALVGDYDVRTFKAASAPVTVNLVAALSNVPLSSYLAVPEFSRALEKPLKKARERRKLTASDVLPDDAARELVSQFINDLQSATRKSTDINNILYGGSALEKFSNISIDIFSFSVDEMEHAAKAAVKSAAEKPLQRYVATKDAVNSKYDDSQRHVDAEMRAASEAAEARRAEALAVAVKRNAPLQQTTTSLQGEAFIMVPPAGGFLYAEDTTTDQHLRWTIVISPTKLPKVLELTDANALVATPNTIASAATSQEFPKASALSDTDRAEYNLRYGSRLLKSWRTQASLHDASVGEAELGVADTPLGFGFSLMATSGSVFNTLRMNDNDIVSRFFRDLVAPYLQSLPTDLKSTGGSQAFQAVRISVLASKKSFADEYAIGDHFWLNYVFRISDVESFAAQKIDAQQLLDRGHISQDGLGRISVKLAAGQ
jgi:hypothetical protein